ncbi:hypothetical protein V2J09_004569 [Rumex salicifolius]
MSDSKDDFGMDQIAKYLPGGLSQENREGLVDALKTKLQDLAGEHANVLETLTPKVRKRVEALRQLQGQHDELEAKFLEERAALEAKYQKLYEPLYTKRYEIVTGEVEVQEVIDEKADEKEDSNDVEVS